MLMYGKVCVQKCLCLPKRRILENAIITTRTQEFSAEYAPYIHFIDFKKSIYHKKNYVIIIDSSMRT